MDSKLEVSRDTKRIETEYSSAGLFRRYARGRIRFLLQRQIMTVTGSLALAGFIGIEWGLIAAAVALLGEGVDAAVLRRFLRLSERGADMRDILRWSAYSAGFQALTISVCVAVAWFLGPNGETAFFCLAYLSAAAIDAGVVKPYHRSAALARLTIYALVCAGLFLTDVIILGDVTLRGVFEMIGAVMMAYMVKGFIDYAMKQFKRNRQNARDLLRRQRIIELGNLELRARSRELRMLSMVAKHANDAVILSGPDRRITWVNDAFTRITGYSADEAIGETPGTLLNTDNTDMREVDRLAASLTAGEPFRGELLNRKRDGREIWVETNVVPVKNESGATDMVVAVERDVSQAKEHAREMAAARLAAEKGERAKADFLATMSHEIRTPMNGVIGMAELLRDSDLGSEERLYADTIHASARALLKIIDDILDLSKLDAGKLSIHPVDFAPGQCLLDVGDLLRPRAEEKGLLLDVTFETKLPAVVHGDDGRLRQILINLIGNAVKFTEAGRVDILVRHEETDRGPRLLVDICDTGIGIPDDKLQSIFEQFSQADAATTRQFGGTGLGLTISRLLAEQMHGTLTATSTEGQGSCFHLAVQLDHPVGEIVDPRETFLDIGRLEGARILLAEDNKTNRLLVERFLRGLPVELHSVVNGAQAVERVGQNTFDIVLMDMSMPVMDGLEATRKIRTLPMAQPTIIALTANAFASDRARCLSVGMDGFLAKPLSRSDLIAALVTAMEQRDLPTKCRSSA